jgi:beta-ketoacyl-acyl-carrier-protein synthase II
LRRVVVTGIGVISPLGDNPDTLFLKLMMAESGIRRITTTGPSGSFTGVAATVDFEPAKYLAQLKIDNLDRVTQFAIAAAMAALKDSAIQLTDGLKMRTGVSLGTGMGAANSIESSYEQLFLHDPDRIKPLTVLTVMNNAPASHIAILYGLKGFNLTYSCACSSSAIAIGEAFRQIRHNYADCAIAGGAEALLTFGQFKAWEAMRVLALADPINPAATCRPFSKNRSGLVLGEGAAMLVLEEREAAMRRGARIYGELVGYGSCNDPSHLTKPSVDGQMQAMTLALVDASLNAGDIDYVNAHGTATILNDVTETRAIKGVFGERAYTLPVSSTKSMHGHLLGAAGAMEFAISLLSLYRQAIPPTAHLDISDPNCDLDYVPGRGRENQKIRNIMSNSFAFGGTNAVLVAGDGYR